MSVFTPDVVSGVKGRLSTRGAFEEFPIDSFVSRNYHLWRADRSSHGGGMLLYVRSDLACDRKVKLECKEIESIFTEIDFNVSCL
jgi:hypothetical protein